MFFLQLAELIGQTYLGFKESMARSARIYRASRISLCINRILCLPSELRHRGIEVFVDTTEPAEFDIRGFQIPDSTVEKIAYALKTVSFSEDDRVFGSLRVRKILGVNVLFTVGRLDGEVIITIAGVQPIGQGPSFIDLLERLEPAATLRGVFGV